MKRLAAVIIACLIAIPGGTFGPSSRIARADTPRYTSVALDSLPLVEPESHGAQIVTSATYRGTTLTGGLALASGNGTAVFHLNHNYDELSGVVYDTHTDNAATFLVYDTSDPSHPRLLFSHHLDPLAHAPFRVQVRNLDYISVATNSWDLFVQGTLSTGSLPPTATTVVSRYPTANAGVPANSKVLVGWQPFPGATNYLFHVWVVNTDASATITAKTPLAFSATAYHSTRYTWDDTGFPTGAYQYALLPLDAHGKALAGWSAPTQITIAS